MKNLNYILGEIGRVVSSTMSALSAPTVNRTAFYIQFYLFFTLITIGIKLIALYTYMQVAHPELGLTDVLWEGFLMQNTTGNYSDILLMIFSTQYFIRSGVLQTRHYRFSDFIKSVDGSTWWYFILVSLTFYGIGYFLIYGDIYLNQNIGGLDSLLILSGFGASYFFEQWTLELIDYALKSLPVVLITVWVVRTKTGKASLSELLQNWRSMVVLLILLTCSEYLMMAFIDMVYSLLIMLISMPFMETVVPMMLSIPLFLYLLTKYFMVVSYLVHYAFNTDSAPSTKRVAVPNDAVLDDLSLDDTTTTEDNELL